MITLIIVVLILLWLSGYFGPPTIPQMTLPTIHIAWSDPLIHALWIILVIVIIIWILR